MPQSGRRRRGPNIYHVKGVTNSGDQILRHSTSVGISTSVENFAPEEATNSLVGGGNRFMIDDRDLKRDFFKDNVIDLSPENRAIFDQIPRTSE